MNMVLMAKTDYVEVRSVDEWEMVVRAYGGSSSTIHEGEKTLCMAYWDDGEGPMDDPVDDHGSDIVTSYRDVIEAMASVIVDGEVLVYEAVGFEGVRGFVGQSVAMNNRGDIRVVSIDDISRYVDELK